MHWHKKVPGKFMQFAYTLHKVVLFSHSFTSEKSIILRVYIHGEHIRGFDINFGVATENPGHFKFCPGPAYYMSQNGDTLQVYVHNLHKLKVRGNYSARVKMSPLEGYYT